MTYEDISNIRRFLGVVEGVSIALPSDAQSLLCCYMEVVDGILNKEGEGNNDAE